MLDRKLGGFISANPPAPTQASAQGVWDGNQQIVAQLQNAWPLPPHVVQRSLRFNSADSAYLSRTPAAAGNRQTWTYSVWIKRGKLGSAYELFTSGTNVVTGPGGQITLRTSDDLRFVSGDGSTLQADLITTQVFRDPSAWYHLVFAVDTTQATSSNRIKIYVNGTQITAFGTATYPSQNANLTWNQAQLQGLFTNVTATNGSSYFDGYAAEVNFVDCPSLVGSTTNGSTTVTLSSGSTANIQVGWNIGGTNIPSGATVSSITNSTTFVISAAATGTGSSITIGATPPVGAFGETDPQTGIWVPKRYTGTYGTNGFRLPFSNNSSTTALGFDASGNGNNWTPNGLSVTPGSGNDSLLDVPSLYGATDTGVGGEVRGNYATFNPLSNPGNSTLSNGNLEVSTPNGTAGRVLSTIGVSSGKWYCEFTVTSVGAGFRTGIVKDGFNNGDIIGKFANEYAYYSDGNKYSNDTAATYGASYTTNDVIGVALDMDNGTLSFSKNGVSQGVAYTGITGTYMFGVCDITGASGVSSIANFGQRPFAFPAPAGFKALCTTNFVAPAIGQTAANQADNHFNVVTYIGNGTAQTITGVGFQPDLVWIKNREANANHRLFDSVRGADKILYSSLPNSEATDANGLTAFISNGFSIGSTQVNDNGQKFVAWCWNAGGNSVTNNAGSNGATIASTYRANKAAGFSVVTYTGNGVDGATVAHGLGAAPAFIIVKSRSNAFNWGVWHKNLAKYDANHAYAIGLNLTRPADATAQYAVFYPGVNTANVFGLGNESTANQSNATYVAYCFAEVPGFSGFGSYTGNLSSDGPFVYTGFRPALVITKRVDSGSTSNWVMTDKARANPFNPITAGGLLYSNLTNNESGSGDWIDFLSNGFKLRGAFTDSNASGGTYIYLAFAEAPSRLALAR